MLPRLAPDTPTHCPNVSSGTSCIRAFALAIPSFWNTPTSSSQASFESLPQCHLLRRTSLSLHPDPAKSPSLGTVKSSFSVSSLQQNISHLQIYAGGRELFIYYICFLSSSTIMQTLGGHISVFCFLFGYLSARACGLLNQQRMND